MTQTYPHVQAAFINSIREEGTRQQACNYLQEQWNETVFLHGKVKTQAAEIARLKAALVLAAIPLESQQMTSMSHLAPEVQGGIETAVTAIRAALESKP